MRRTELWVNSWIASSIIVFGPGAGMAWIPSWPTVGQHSDLQGTCRRPGASQAHHMTHRSSRECSGEPVADCTKLRALLGRGVPPSTIGPFGNASSEGCSPGKSRNRHVAVVGALAYWSVGAFRPHCPNVCSCCALQRSAIVPLRACPFRPFSGQCRSVVVLRCGATPAQE